jgi:hypothetical protein
LEANERKLAKKERCKAARAANPAPTKTPQPEPPSNSSDPV